MFRVYTSNLSKYSSNQVPAP